MSRLRRSHSTHQKNVTKARSNVLIEVTGQPPRRIHNDVTDDGLAFILKRLRGGPVPAISWACGFGTGSTATSGEETELVSEVDDARRLFDISTTTDGELSLYAYLELTAGNGNTIKEIGAFTSDDPDDEDAILYARALVDPSVVKDNSVAVAVTWLLTWGRPA